MLATQTAQSVIDHGLTLGADFAEIFVEKSQSSNVNTLGAKVQSGGVRYRLRHRAPTSVWHKGFVRVYKQHQCQ